MAGQSNLIVKIAFHSVWIALEGQDPNLCQRCFPVPHSQPLKVMIIESRFYDKIADELLEGAKSALDAFGVQYEVISVPGAFEIPAVIAMPSPPPIVTRRTVIPSFDPDRRELIKPVPAKPSMVAITIPKDL